MNSIMIQGEIVKYVGTHLKMYSYYEQTHLAQCHMNLIT